MLVFGDKAATRPTRAALAAVEKVWRNAAGASGLDRHALLISAFIAMAELSLPGPRRCSWSFFDTAGFDELDPATEAAMRLLEAVACEVIRAPGTAASKSAPTPAQGPRFPSSFRRLHQARLPEAVTGTRLKAMPSMCFIPRPMPWPHVAPARARYARHRPAQHRYGAGRDGGGRTRCKGHHAAAAWRSIRPRSEVGPDRNMCPLNTETRFAIVDEGPGLSGSSFGCVADWLEDNGVAPERIHVFPGHDGPLGPAASARHRDRWAAYPAPCRRIRRGDQPQLSRLDRAISFRPRLRR